MLTVRKGCSFKLKKLLERSELGYLQSLTRAWLLMLQTAASAFYPVC